MLYGYSTSINQTKPLMVIALLSLLLNIVVNWLLVFGTLGFPRLGGLGCAWATLITVAFNLVALLWWMHRRQRLPRHLAVCSQFEPPHWPQISSLLKLGLPIGITYFAETSAFSLIALLIAKFGSTQMAAHQIALNFTSLVVHGAVEPGPGTADPRRPVAGRRRPGAGALPGVGGRGAGSGVCRGVGHADGAVQPRRLPAPTPAMRP